MPAGQVVQIPKSFRRIRLELARERRHPEGDSQFGYQLVVPLTEQGLIDPEMWKKYRDNCRVVRFRPDGDRDVGHIVRRPGGSWALRYDISGDEDDETGYRLGDDRFISGEYVSIRDDDETHTFRVVSVERL